MLTAAEYAAYAQVRTKVALAIKLGELVVPSVCEKCGGAGTPQRRRRSLEAHHDDYNFPLAVRWLCQRCHKRWHVRNKAIPL